LVSTVPRMIIFFPMTFAHDLSKEVKGDVVSYLATAQRRAPSAWREDRKMVLKNPDGCDGSIAINHSDWFVGSPHRDADDFSRFMNTLLSKYT
jgi:hypothetical protein